MLFGMGFFIAIFIAIARCANRTGGPHGRTARARFALVWVALYG